MTVKDLEEVINEIDAMIFELENMMGDKVWTEAQIKAVAST